MNGYPEGKQISVAQKQQLDNHVHNPIGGIARVPHGFSEGAYLHYILHLAFVGQAST